MESNNFNTDMFEEKASTGIILKTACKINRIGFIEKNRDVAMTVALPRVQQMQQVQQRVKKRVKSLTRLRTFKEVVSYAKSLPPMKPLFGTLLQEGELVILAGDTGVGKSIFAVTIANSVASGTPLCDILPTTAVDSPILYYDLELSDRMFGKRFNTDVLPDNLIRVDMSPEYPECEFDFTSITADIEETGASFIIMDNISALCMAGTTIDADVAQKIMRELKKIQKDKGVTILVLAHVPKIPPYSPLSINHVSGSKAITNFADSVFFIAKSTKGDAVRYIKQVKCRNAEDMNGVISCQIVKKDFLTIEITGHDTEKNHLPVNSPNEKKETAYRLRQEGKTYEQIASELNVDKSTVCRWVKV